MDLQLKNSFGLAAKDYQRYRRMYDVKLYELLFTLTKGDDLSILDIGCGTGKSTEPIFNAANNKTLHVTGIDPDEAMLAEAKISAEEHKLPITYVQGSAEKMPFEPASFDAIISGAAFHWYGSVKVLRKIKPLLKKDGVFFIFWVQYVNENEKTIGEDIFKRYKWKGIPKKFRGQDYVAELLTESGFSDVTKASLPFVETHTIPDIIGLFKTNSSYILLPDSDKEDFLRDMTKAYEDVLGKGGEKIDKMELRVCYGFNK